MTLSRRGSQQKELHIKTTVPGSCSFYPPTPRFHQCCMWWAARCVHAEHPCWGQDGFPEWWGSPSQSHRLVEVGRDLQRSPGPTCLLKQGRLELLTQNHIQMAFDYPQGWRIHCTERDEEGGFCLEGRDGAPSCKVTGIAVCWGSLTMMPKSKARCTDLSPVSLPTHLICTFSHPPSPAFSISQEELGLDFPPPCPSDLLQKLPSVRLRSSSPSYLEHL